MKKMTVLFLGLAFMLVVSAAILLGYVYSKDTGVSLTGRARLDYNWDYIFAEAPKHVANYEGKLFSFSYLDYNDKNPLRPFEEESGGYMFGDLLAVHWFLKPPAEVKSELLGYLSSPGGKSWEPSKAFAEWMVSETDKYYIASVEKIILKNGVPAALFSVKAKHDALAGNYRYLVTEHKGVVVRMENIAGAEVSNEQYRLLVFVGMELFTMQRQVHPDGARDRNSARMFTRIIETFEFKS
ncbi:MAG TPA: hypothetical protein DCS63_09210 [Elusimicrobia bacterium]|nr:hypothetical protein [Elusimicrobiota bacterium]